MSIGVQFTADRDRGRVFLNIGADRYEMNQSEIESLAGVLLEAMRELRRVDI